MEPSQPSFASRLFAWIAPVAVGLVAVELSCAVLFNVFAARFTFFAPHQFAPAREQLPMLKRYFDPELGWRRPLATEFGERPSPRTYGRPLLSTFGDSFTFGDEVGDADTWEAALAQRLAADVYNFGGSAYGTDQAYLRFQRDYPKTNTPLVTLGLITQDIDRIVGVYRKFSYLKTQYALTKPRFELRNGSLMLVSNPIQRADDIERLYDPQFLAEIGAHDWWYNRDDYPVLGFPYTRILFNRRLWLEAAYGRGAQKVDDLSPRPWEDLWQIDGPRALMAAILSAFATEASARGAQPIVMLLPQRHELQAAVKGGKIPAVERFREMCRAHRWQCFDGLAALAQSVANKEDIPGLYLSAHLSPLGNRRVADAFYDYLRNNRLLPEDFSTVVPGQ